MLTPGPPLGLGLGLTGTYPETTVALAPGDTLLLYSDGVIERRGQDITDGITALTAALAHAPTGDARSLAAPATPGRPRRHRGRRRGPRPGTGRVTEPARRPHHAPEGQGPGQARRWLLQTLHTWQVPDDLADTAALCLSELTTNALLHAGTHASIELDLTAERLLVTDTGARGTPIRPEPHHLSSRGRGLNLIDTVTDAWGTEPLAHGTRVWFELLLTT